MNNLAHDFRAAPRPSPNVYSYTRFSTPEQAAGDSYRRQSEAAAKWAKERGLVLDEKLALSDEGVSAFRGANTAEDAGLGRFLYACREGLIDPGSYLIVENLDRISRADPFDAQAQFMEIVRNRVTIVTLQDGQEYSRERMTAEPWALMAAFMVAVRAHEESKTKGRRVAAAWAEKRRRVRDGTDPMLTGRAPPWLKWEGDKWTVDESRAEAVRRVYRMTVEGFGEHRIAETLNREGVPPIGRGAMWHRSAVSKLLRASTVIGTLTPGHMTFEGGKKRRKLEEPIPNAYPTIVDLGDWHTVRSIKDGATASVRGRGAKRPLANILAGLARCPDCGAAMTRVMKGTARKGGRPKLACTRAKAGAARHPYVSVDLANVETAFRNDWQALAGDVPASDAGGTLNATCDVLRGEVDYAETKLETISADYDSRPSQAIAAKLQAAEVELASLRNSLEEAEERRSVVDGGLIHARLGQLQEAIERECEEREPINAALRSLFDAVTVDHHSGRLRFAWKQGGETTIIYAMPPQLTSDAMSA